VEVEEVVVAAAVVAAVDGEDKQIIQ